MVQLNKGDKAPMFSGVNQNGETVSFADYSGKKLILYFYPKDNTSGCTAQACSLRDGYSELAGKGYQVVGVSPDSAKSHRGFIEKHSLNFTLIADTDNSIMKAYGAWGKKKMYGKEYEGVLRTTFIIDQYGIIEHVITKVDTAAHTQQILDIINT